MVIEPFLEESRDLQVAVRTHPGTELSAIEAPKRAGSGIYSYHQKYLAWGGEVSGGRDLPASLDPEVEAALREMAVKVAAVAGLRGVCRIDFLEQGGRLWVNEVNTIPGSMAAYLWISPPISRGDLFGAMLEEALSGPVRRYSTAGSDGSALRNATSIAFKLG
jgi:D-alanine-D-alanine ligase